jgi:hypothetical protein
MPLTQQPAPRVFISYSHDTLEHQERVLDLADRLRADGINVEVDQYTAAPAEGWPLWCERQITAAAVVLMVCTETYHRRVTGDEEQGKGLGVVWEARIIRQLLYDAGTVSDKFVPVLFSDASPEQIPTPIKGWTRYVVDTEDGYEDLYRRLSGQPRLMQPALGTIRALPPRRRQWPEGRAETTPPPGGSTLTASASDREKRAMGDKNVDVGGTMIGSAVVTGDHNATTVHYRRITLSPANSVDIRAELADLKELLVGLNTQDRSKIENAFAEAAEDAAKPQPDKDEIGRALERALGYAGKAADFGSKQRR